MVDLDSLSIEQQTIQLLPKATAFALMVLPLRVEKDGTLLVATATSDSNHILADLQFITGRAIAVARVNREQLLPAIKKYYGEQTAPSTTGDEPPDGVPSDIQSSSDALAELTAVSAVNKIITDAIRMRASDIHIEPYEKSLRIRYRLDGVLHEVLHQPIDKARALISRLKIMADLDIAEKRRPQDGRIRVKEGNRVIDIRVSSLPTDFGEKIVLRILDKTQLRLDLAVLGFCPEDMRLFEKTIRLPYGMILVTGPTGSGKTTTLYAALNNINRPEVNITTIEDPIEYNLAGINQTQVRADIGLTFAAVLRSILRQDPNVVMVGEIRDSETAEIAIRAALTGHLVFSTLHTNDAPSALTRLVDMGVEPFLVASSVKMILAQRLLRRICPDCGLPYHPKTEEREELGITNAMHGFLSGTGCPACNQTGYRGRLAVYEILSVTNSLADLIAKNASVADIRKSAQQHGMKTLREAAVIAAQNGMTTIQEILRETVAP